MKEKLLEFLRIPPEVRSVFWQDILQKNRLSLLVICVMIFGMELFNMARVLFLSSVGLGTLNNRIYFGLYFSLWLAAALYLLLSYRTRRAPARKRWAVQYGAVLFFLLWHVVCNAYDLIQGHSAATTIYITAVLALAVFIQMPGLFSIIAYVSAYTLFMALTAPVLDEGAKINLTFTTIVSLAVSLTTCRHTVVMTAQRQEIDQINRQLHTLLQRDPLTGLLNTAAFSHCVERCLADAPAEGMATLLIIDLDDFKSVNDQYGHPCGDYVLQETALRLQAVFPGAEGIGRIGGDEFAVVLRETEEAAVERMGQQLIEAVSAITWQRHRVGAGCSVGGCRFRRSDVTYEQIYHQADQTLYEAKGMGKGRCRLRTL